MEPPTGGLSGGDAPPARRAPEGAPYGPHSGLPPAAHSGLPPAAHSGLPPATIAGAHFPDSGPAERGEPLAPRGPGAGRGVIGEGGGGGRGGRGGNGASRRSRHCAVARTVTRLVTRIVTRIVTRLAARRGARLDLADGLVQRPGKREREGGGGRLDLADGLVQRPGGRQERLPVTEASASRARIIKTNRAIIRVIIRVILSRQPLVDEEHQR